MESENVRDRNSEPYNSEIFILSHIQFYGFNVDYSHIFAAQRKSLINLFLKLKKNNLPKWGKSKKLSCAIESKRMNHQCGSDKFD